MRVKRSSGNKYKRSDIRSGCANDDDGTQSDKPFVEKRHIAFGAYISASTT